MATVSKEEFNAHMKGLRELIEEKFNTNETGHQAILTQTTKTNGRVNKLEEWRNNIEGAWSLIKIVGVANIILLIALWAEHLKK